MRYFLIDLYDYVHWGISPVYHEPFWKIEKGEIKISPYKLPVNPNQKWELRKMDERKIPKNVTKVLKKMSRKMKNNC